MSKRRNANIDQLCAMFKALANPQRLRVFLKLANCSAPATLLMRSAIGLLRNR
jgi:hypothetical protein